MRQSPLSAEELAKITAVMIEALVGEMKGKHEPYFLVGVTDHVLRAVCSCGQNLLFSWDYQLKPLNSKEIRPRLDRFFNEDSNRKILLPPAVEAYERMQREQSAVSLPAYVPSLREAFQEGWSQQVRHRLAQRGYGKPTIYCQSDDDF